MDAEDQRGGRRLGWSLALLALLGVGTTSVWFFAQAPAEAPATRSMEFAERQPAPSESVDTGARVPADGSSPRSRRRTTTTPPTTTPMVESPRRDAPAPPRASVPRYAALDGVTTWNPPWSHANTAVVWTRGGYDAQLLAAPPQRDVTGYANDFALDGDVAVIAEPFALAGRSQRGVVHVFHRAPVGSWLPTLVLASPDENEVFFGRAVAVSGSRIVVASGGLTPESPPAVHSYARTKDGWTHEQTIALRADGPTTMTIALSHDLLAVNIGNEIELYRHHTDGFLHSERLTRGDAQRWSGVSLALDGARLVVPSLTEGGQRSLRVFEDSGGRFRPTATLDKTIWRKGLDPSGSALALTGDTLAVGGSDLKRGLIVLEYDGGAWGSPTDLAVGPMRTNGPPNSHGADLDGDLLAAGLFPHVDGAFGILVARRRSGAWHTGIADPRRDAETTEGVPHHRASVAVSGDTVMVHWTTRVSGPSISFLTIADEFPVHDD